MTNNAQFALINHQLPNSCLLKQQIEFIPEVD